MSTTPPNPYTALKTIFHEPSRLAIMSALSCAASGLTFTDLKRECELTDGNLSRHLKALEEADVIEITKAFVDAKPCTTVLLSDQGRERFMEYLQALEEVLKKAAEAVAPASDAASKAMPLGKLARAPR